METEDGQRCDGKGMGADNRGGKEWKKVASLEIDSQIYNEKFFCECWK